MRPHPHVPDDSLPEDRDAPRPKRPGAADPRDGDGPAASAWVEELRALLRSATTTVRLRLLRTRLRARDAVLLVVAGIAGTAVLIVLVAAAALIALRGLDRALAAWTGAAWAGDLLAGTIVIAAVFVGLLCLRRSRARASRDRFIAAFGQRNGRAPAASDRNARPGSGHVAREGAHERHEDSC